MFGLLGAPSPSLNLPRAFALPFVLLVMPLAQVRPLGTLHFESCRLDLVTRERSNRHFFTACYGTFSTLLDPSHVTHRPTANANDEARTQRFYALP